VAASHVNRAATDAGIVADMAAARNEERILIYRSSLLHYIFQPIAVENLGAFSTTLNFISELGRQIHIQSADVREGSFLFQCISVVVQRFNSVLLHDTLIANLPDP